MPIRHTHLLFLPVFTALLQLAPLRDPTLGDRVGARGVQSVGAPCAVVEVSRSRLTVEGGSQLFVEPVVLETDRRGDVLLAGRRSYLFGPRQGGGWMRGDDSRVLGAIIPRQGSARIVRSPIPTRLIGLVRAAPRRGGGWDVLLAELAQADSSDSVARLWHGVLEGERWVSFDTVPHARGGRLVPVGASSLIRFGDTLGFALPIRTPDHQTSVAIFKLHQGHWSRELVPTLIAAYTALAHSPSSGLILAVVQPDLSLESDANSLFLWARSPDWRKIVKAASGSDAQVHRPTLIFVDETAILGWAAAPQSPPRRGLEARARAGPLANQDGPVMKLDSMVRFNSSVAPIQIAGGSRVWVMDHVPVEQGQGQIRFVHEQGGLARTFGAIATPYVTPFRAASIAPAEVLIAGGIHDPAQDLVVTMLLRTRVECRPPGV